MAGTVQGANGRRPGSRFTPWRIALWGIASFILLLPLVAMQFTDEVKWTFPDFLLLGGLLGGAGLVVELAARLSGHIAYRAAALVAVVASFLLVWMNLAAGLLGDDDNPANLMFLGVIGVAAAGSIVGRFRPAACARALFAAAAAQALVGAIAMAAGLASPGETGVYEVVLSTAIFAPLWLLSAWLFRRAAKAEAAAPSAG